MSSFFSTVATLSLASLALCSPHTSHVHPKAAGASPCAKVGAELARQNVTSNAWVPAQLAYDCITSIPFHQSDAIRLIDSLKPYLRWQSTTAWAANPPREYVEKLWPAYDLWGVYHQIRNKVVAGSYKSDYEFNLELFQMAMNLRDGHFFYLPDVLAGVFSFPGSTALVSVSNDGKELPKAYVYRDIVQESLGNVTWTPSHVTQINGHDATKYLENLSEKVNFPDRDVLWNVMFYSLANRSPAAGQFGPGGFAGGGPTQFYYHGANLSMTFANGTSWTHPNRAWVFASFDGVTDGESLYQKNFANKQLESQTGGSNSAAAAAASSSSEPDVPVTGYPPAVVHAPRYMVSGYYLDGDYSDIAVLSVPSFSPTGPGASSIPFQSAAAKFITGAKQAGKKKLIIDLQANLGGTVLLPTDLYKILFPTKSDRGPADQLRAFEDAEFLFQKYSAGAAGIPVVYNSTNATLQDLVNNVVTPPFNYRTGVDINGKPFTSWEAKYGPVSANNDTFTNRFRWDINSPLVPFYSNGIYVHGGYGPFSNYNSTPFLPEDVIIVTDGMCGSSCSVFVELMRRGADVKVISLGGRPQPGLTQPLGTMKGSVVMSSAEVQGFVQYALANLTSAEEAARLNKTQLGEYWDDTHVVRSAGAGGLGINMFNTIRNEDETLTPLQFVYEPADCRILYTKNMTVDITAVWKAVADSAWGGRDQCIAGSVVNAGSASLGKRELSDTERAHSNKMAEWRASLKPSDYEFDAGTEAAMLRPGKFWNGL